MYKISGSDSIPALGNYFFPISGTTCFIIPNFHLRQGHTDLWVTLKQIVGWRRVGRSNLWLTFVNSHSQCRNQNWRSWEVSSSLRVSFFTLHPRIEVAWAKAECIGNLRDGLEFWAFQVSSSSSYFRHCGSDDRSTQPTRGGRRRRNGGGGGREGGDWGA